MYGTDFLGNQKFRIYHITPYQDKNTLSIFLKTCYHTYATHHF